MLWQFINITFKRLNILFSEQKMREQGFDKVEWEMPKSFTVKAYLETCPCFLCYLLAYDLCFFLLVPGLQKIQPTLLLILKIFCKVLYKGEITNQLWNMWVAIIIWNCNKLFSSNFDIPIKELRKWNHVISCSWIKIPNTLDIQPVILKYSYFHGYGIRSRELSHWFNHCSQTIKFLSVSFHSKHPKRTTQN